MVDHYKILNLPRNAMPSEIDEAFRKYAPIHIINSKTDSTFNQLCQSYEILSDPGLRVIYDKKGIIHINFTDPKIIYDSVFYPSKYVTRHFSNKHPIYNDYMIKDSIANSYSLGRG